MFRSYRDGAVLADTAVGELLGTGVLSLCRARSASSSGICDLSGIADSFSSLGLLFHRTDKAGVRCRRRRHLNSEVPNKVNS